MIPARLTKPICIFEVGGEGESIQMMLAGVSEWEKSPGGLEKMDDHALPIMEDGTSWNQCNDMVYWGQSNSSSVTALLPEWEAPNGPDGHVVGLGYSFDETLNSIESTWPVWQLWPISAHPDWAELIVSVLDERFPGWQADKTQAGQFPASEWRNVLDLTAPGLEPPLIGLTLDDGGNDVGETGQRSPRDHQ